MIAPSSQRRYIARLAEGQHDLAAAQALRTRAFGLTRPDGDTFDAQCTHIVVEDRREGRLVACFRLMALAGADFTRSYAAQFYDLTALADYPGHITELGRFCVDPAAHDPDILRAAWGEITAHVDDKGVALLIGCTSLRGTDPAPYREAFAALAAHHLAPPAWRPGRRTANAVPLVGEVSDPAAARAMMPPLLRSYLGMGGWVSDHAVIDPEMNTIHVFTGLEIARIPEARKRRLRSTLDGGSAAR
ncbi:GNAT family N-acetyltransferase [Roseovarius sp. S4756]|uniref:GNAT family N-acetyltransferase n=1 Tax=Roseovarius maritimus TaxID=3342637 RepID=UPI00372A224C